LYRIAIDADDFKKELLAKPKPTVDFSQHRLHSMKLNEDEYKGLMTTKYTDQLKQKIASAFAMQKYQNYLCNNCGKVKNKECKCDETSSKPTAKSSQNDQSKDDKGKIKTVMGNNAL
jgi:hypothetical protein